MERDARIDQLRQALADFRPGSLFDHEAEEAKAAVRKRALLFLDARARSRHELRGRLLDLEFEEAVVDDVLDDLAGVGLLDDAAFARAAEALHLSNRQVNWAHLQALTWAESLSADQ